MESLERRTVAPSKEKKAILLSSEVRGRLGKVPGQSLGQGHRPLCIVVLVTDRRATELGMSLFSVRKGWEKKEGPPIGILCDTGSRCQTWVKTVRIRKES